MGGVRGGPEEVEEEAAERGDDAVQVGVTQDGYRSYGYDQGYRGGNGGYGGGYDCNY